jgi:hypothetical protein
MSNNGQNVQDVKKLQEFYQDVENAVQRSGCPGYQAMIKMPRMSGNNISGLSSRNPGHLVHFSIRLDPSMFIVIEET